MNKVLIHYFSGTGNSILAATQLSKELGVYGYNVVLHAVEHGSYHSDDTYYLHIFFFPIYATSIPHIMLRYMRNLPDGKNVKAAIISTNGRISTRFRDGYQGWALHEARLCLKLKKYDVFFSDTLDYPHNITFFIPPRKENNNQKDIEQASKRIVSIAEKIARVQKFHRSFLLPNIIWSIPFGIFYSLFVRRFIGKMFVADSKCNSCQLCVKQCPVKTIKTYHGQIRWRWNCEGCMRCINACPKQAIQVSALRITAIFVAASLNPTSFIASIAPVWFIKSMGDFGSVIFNTLVDVALFMAFFILFDWIIFMGSYIPILNKVAGWGYTRFYGRYHTDGAKNHFSNKK